MSAAGPLAPGTALAPGIEALAHLSRGLHLDVYDAWSTRRACRVVAKVLRPDARRDRAAQRRLEREGELLERLGHPHLVRAYETLHGPHGPVVVLETLEGETLSALIARRARRLPAAEVAWLGLHLCSALHYLHGEGLLHLDLKPSNIVSDLGRATLIDLSLARAPGRVPRGLGTAEYLSPEQARGGTATAATDAWGLGAVLFAAATAQRPFAARAGGASYEQLERRAARVRTLRRLPRPLADAIDACLEPHPADRPALGDLVAALEAVAG